MRRLFAPVAVAASLALIAGGSAQAGCLGGAVVGGVGGHFAGRHPILGAAAGCAVGHHLAKKHARERAAGVRR